jgi:hypothetical protein
MLGCVWCGEKWEASGGVGGTYDPERKRNTMLEERRR